MEPGVRNTLLGIAAFISVILGLMLASIINPRPMSDEDAAQIGYYRFDEPRLISAFSMTDHLGRRATLSNLKGRWSLLFFGFTTCPDVCPTTLSVLNEAISPLEDPPAVVMVSVDPDRDTPEQLARYVPAFNSNFIGYTGTFGETVKLAQQLNIAFGKVPGDVPGSYLVDHSASLVLIDPNGRYAGFIKAPHNASNIQRVLRGLSI
jgi:protein SCO1/2